MAVDPKPNTQPIYPKKLFTWKAEITNEIINVPVPIPNVLQSTFPAIPVLPKRVGIAGECGALIWAVHVSLVVTYIGHVHFYSRRVGDSDLLLRWSHLINTTNTFSMQVCSLPPILPNDQKGLHLEAEEELFIAMQTVLPSPATVTVIGGHY